MNKYLSLIFLYNRASYKKLLFLIGAIPVLFLAFFLLKVGNPYEAGPEMLMERAFGGAWTVLLFIGVNLLGLVLLSSSLNGRISLKANCSTTGYTVRRLSMSPISSYITIFIYYLAILLIFWGVAIISLYAIGKIALTMAGATSIDIKLALGFLRTDIGHALIPIQHPAVIIFNIVAVLALAGEYAKACYLSWHNGTPSAGVALIIAAMFLTWGDFLDNTYLLIVILIISFYALVSFADVISREKRPKGDPFKVNKYSGLIDLDSEDFESSVYAPVANTPIIDPSDKSKKSKLDLLRCRFMPLGANLEKINAFFGACIAIGIGEHLVFLFKYILCYKTINNYIKGVTILAGVRMPYFWDLQAHTYYGYVAAILLTLFVQAYWNYEYYNKKTKSVYVMKRLPDQREYARTIWFGPAIQALCIVAIMFVHTLIDLGVYLIITPDIAFYSDYLSHIIPF